MVGAVSASEISFVSEAVFMNIFYPKAAKTVKVQDGLWNPFVDFATGFVDAIKEDFQSDMGLFTQCIAAPKGIWARILTFVDYVKSIDWKNFDFSDFIENVMDLVMGSFGDAVPCIVLGMIIDKFVELIISPTIDNLKYTLLKTLAANAQTIFNDLMDFAQKLITGVFYDAGQDIGEIVYLILIH